MIECGLMSLLVCLQATSGLGKAAAYALSKEGFYVVLGAHSIVILLLLFVCLIFFFCLL